MRASGGPQPTTRMCRPGATRMRDVTRRARDVGLIEELDECRQRLAVGLGPAPEGGRAAVIAEAVGKATRSRQFRQALEVAGSGVGHDRMRLRYSYPSVSATCAPRSPIGSAGPRVESRTVWRSVSALISAPTRIAYAVRNNQSRSTTTALIAP